MNPFASLSGTPLIAAQQRVAHAQHCLGALLHQLRIVLEDLFERRLDLPVKLNKIIAEFFVCIHELILRVSEAGIQLERSSEIRARGPRPGETRDDAVLPRPPTRRRWRGSRSFNAWSVGIIGHGGKDRSRATKGGRSRPFAACPDESGP